MELLANALDVELHQLAQGDPNLISETIEVWVGLHITLQYQEYPQWFQSLLEFSRCLQHQTHRCFATLLVKVVSFKIWLTYAVIWVHQDYQVSIGKEHCPILTELVGTGRQQSLASRWLCGTFWERWCTDRPSGPRLSTTFSLPANLYYLLLRCTHHH